MIKSFADQVLELHPYNANEWVKAGDLQQAKDLHTVLSIGAQELPCLAGGSFNRVESKFISEMFKENMKNSVNNRDTYLG